VGVLVGEGLAPRVLCVAWCRGDLMSERSHDRRRGVLRRLLLRCTVRHHELDIKTATSVCCILFSIVSLHTTAYR